MVEWYKRGGLGDAAEWAGGFVKGVGATRCPERTPKSPFEVTLWGERYNGGCGRCLVVMFQGGFLGWDCFKKDSGESHGQQGAS